MDKAIRVSPVTSIFFYQASIGFHSRTIAAVLRWLAAKKMEGDRSMMKKTRITTNILWATLP
jgi:hypothetical protein